MQKRHDDKYQDRYNSDGDEESEDDLGSDGPESNKSLMQSWKFNMEEDILQTSDLDKEFAELMGEARMAELGMSKVADKDEKEKYLKDGIDWHWIPFIGDVDWDDSKLISATYSSTVWSPFAIPHALHLSHDYYSKTGWSSVDFFCKWEYDTWDFEDVNFRDGKDTLLCSKDWKGLTT